MEWTEQMLETMMHEVYQKKLHLMANKAGSKGAWEEFLDHLFEQRDFIPLKTAYYKRGNPRNIRKKYQDTLDLIKRDLETGNQSGKEGERSTLYKLVENIFYDIDEAEATKKSAEDLKRKLDENVDLVLAEGGRKKPTKGWGVRMGLDGQLDSGSTTTSSVSSKTASPSFEEQLLNMLKEPISQAQDVVEETVKDTMQEYLESSDKNIYDCILESRIAGDCAEQVNELGLDVLISIYCARGLNFAQEPFKTALEKVGISVLACHKAYALLQKWCKAAMAVRKEDSFRTPN